MITAPALRYFGGKWKLADWIITHFPQHKVYIEPFGGAASVLLRKHPAQLELYNDVNSDLVHFFRVLRENTSELVESLYLTPYSREEHLLCRQATNNDIERARRFYVMSSQGRSFSGSSDTRSSWRVYCKIREGSGAHRVTDYWCNLENLMAVAERIRRVQIEQMDGIQCIQRYDSKDALLYVDPPYDLETRGTNRYAFEVDKDYQKLLAQNLHTAKGMVVLSGYRGALYEELYGDWHLIEKKSATMAVNTGTARGIATESLWLNQRAWDALPRLFK